LVYYFNIVGRYEKRNRSQELKNRRQNSGDRSWWKKEVRNVRKLGVKNRRLEL